MDKIPIGELNIAGIGRFRLKMIRERSIQYYEFSTFRLDVANRKLFKGDEPLQLTQKTLELLLFLLKNSGKIIEKQEFFDSVWSESFVDSTNLTQHIYRIRKILDDPKNGEIFIETIPKRGYKFNADVKEIRNGAEELEAGFLGLETPTKPHNGYADPPASDAFYFETEAISVYPLKTPSSRNKNKERKPESDSKFRSKKSGIILVVVGLALIASAITYFAITIQNRENKGVSIVVLPFNQIGASQDETLKLGIADTLISNISKIPGLRVNPTNSIVQYANGSRSAEESSLFEIGKKLEADILITGTIQIGGERVRVHLQFYYLKDRTQICVSNFDNDLVDVFKLQDIVVNKVTEKLVTELKNHKDNH